MDFNYGGYSNFSSDYSFGDFDREEANRENGQKDVQFTLDDYEALQEYRDSFDRSSIPDDREEVKTNVHISVDNELKNQKWSRLAGLYENLKIREKISTDELQNFYSSGLECENLGWDCVEEYDLLESGKEFLINQIYSHYRREIKIEENVEKLFLNTKQTFELFKDSPKFDQKQFCEILKIIEEGLEISPAMNVNPYYGEEIRAMAATLSTGSMYQSKLFASISPILFFEFISKPAPRSDVEFSIPVGFENSGVNHCRTTTFLHLMFCIPEYKKAYLYVAENSAPEIGKSLIFVLSKYEECFSRQLTVPCFVAQHFQEAYTLLLAKHRHLAPPSDLHEDLDRFLAVYREMAKERWIFSGIFSEVKTIDTFVSEGEPSFSSEQFKQMPDNDRIETVKYRASVVFDFPKDIEEIDFEALKHSYFKSAPFTEAKYYKIGTRIKCLFKKTTKQRFLQCNRLLLTLNRFLGSSLNSRVKVLTKTAVPLCMSVSDERAGRELELHTFVSHSGSLENGYYILYRKIEGQWLMLLNEKRETVSEEHVKQVLSGEAGDNLGFLHFYAPKINENKRERDENVQIEGQPSVKKIKPISDP